MRLFQDLSLIVNAGLFALAAAFVWFAGTRIAHYADAISNRTGLGQAVLGVLLLGGVTSLPELAVTASATATGSPILAVNNLFGGVAMQVAILAAADAAIGRNALSSSVPNPTVLLQGSLCIILLAIAAAGTLVGDVQVLGVGLWLWLLVAVFLYAIFMVSRSQGTRPWVATPKEGSDDEAERGQETPQSEALGDIGLSGIILRTAVAAIAITAAGFVLSQTGEAIAQKSGLGSSFVGAVLVAVATSLPEVSTTLSAARLGLYTMAISDVFGTNLFDVALLFVVDAIAEGGPVLGEAGRFATAAAILGILMTAIYLAGLAERRDRTVLRMGVDSVAVLVAYLAGIAILYQLR